MDCGEVSADAVNLSSLVGSIVFSFTQVLSIDPGRFKIINEMLQKECKAGRIEIMDLNATAAASANTSGEIED